MPAGVDEHDVPGLDRGLGPFQVGGLDELPFLLGDRQHHAGAEEAIEREIAHRLRPRQQVDRRIHMQFC